MVHCKEVTDADRSSRIAGSARLTMVTSMLTTNRLEQQITSTSRRCLRSSSGTGPLRDGGVATVALRRWRLRRHNHWYRTTASPRVSAHERQIAPVVAVGAPRDQAL